MDVTKVKESRKRGVVIFSKFCVQSKENSDCLFCFFEGEDNKYYAPRIEAETKYDSNQIINYNCGGRKEVERVFKLILNKPEYSFVNKMFFIDKDYAPSDVTHADLYQTPCYSIENFYTSKECFGRIIQREFGINTIENDYKKCLEDYKNLQTTFHDGITFLNAWLACQRKEEEIHKKKLINLSNFKVAQLFSIIDICKIDVKKEINEELLLNIFSKHYSINNEQIQMELDFFQKSNKQQTFRGKFELEFMKKVLESLVVHNKNHTYFSESYTSVQLAPHVNTLSALSDYADTPCCLVAFLQQHKRVV